MCFSPTASFGASVVLGGIGVASIASSRTVPQKVLSGIPILFALQQFTEGVLWLALQRSDWSQWQTIATYGFLVFAQMVWPVYVPLSMLLFEQEARRRKIIGVLTVIGVLLASYVGVCMYHYPVSAVADHHHIRYVLEFPLARKWSYGLFYFIPTILAPLVSTTKSLRWLGYLFLGSWVMVRILFAMWVISVWCFFGAIISLVVLFIVLRLNGHLERWYKPVDNRKASI
jgi:hypothetical protein